MASLQHGSHPHPLQQVAMTEANMGAARCRACDMPFTSTNNPFGCVSCGFFLHRSCSMLQQSLPANHVHQHPLDLLYRPTDPYGIFSCRICGKTGRGFNYHCRSCQFGVHALCTKLPQYIRRAACHQHLLWFLSRPPLVGNTNCGVCSRQVNFSCYSCSGCNFFVHANPDCFSRRPMTGTVNNQQAARRRGSQLATNAAVGFGTNLLARTAFHLFGIDDMIDDWRGEGVDEYNDFEHGDHLGNDMHVFDELPGFDGNPDSELETESNYLAFQHLASTGGCL